MRTRIIFSLCCINCLIFTSCMKHCRSFPEHLVDYFPYNRGDTLCFVNQNKDTLSFLVSEFSKTEESSESRCGTCDCEVPTYSIDTYNREHQINMDVSIQLYRIPRITFVFRKLSGMVGSPDQVSVLEFYDKTCKNPFDAKNSTLFGDTVIVNIPLYGDQEIDEATIVKGKGIMSFHDRKKNIRWENIKK